VWIDRRNHILFKNGVFIFLDVTPVLPFVIGGICVVVIIIVIVAIIIICRRRRQRAMGNQSILAAQYNPSAQRVSYPSTYGSER